MIITFAQYKFDTASPSFRKAAVELFAASIFILGSWILALFIGNLSFKIHNIVQLHFANPVLFFVELAVISIFVYKNYNSFVLEKEKLKIIQNLKIKETQIEKNIQLAKEIGQGNYQFNIQVSDDDLLSLSLLKMRANLIENKTKEEQYKWISEGKYIISNVLRSHNKINDLSYEVLIAVIKYINATQGVFYLFDEKENCLTTIASYAYSRRKNIQATYKVGEGLPGECAFERDIIYRKEIPQDYISISSGILGDFKPCTLILYPMISNDQVQGVLEIASLEPELSKIKRSFIKEACEITARSIFNLRVSERTEELLFESQKMTEELRHNEERLRQSAVEMSIAREDVEKSNVQLELKIKEVENAQKRVNSLLENASEVISIYDQNLNITYLSPSVSKILSYSVEEIMGGKFLSRLTRKGEAEFKNMFQILVENPFDRVSIQYTFMKRDGLKVFLETTGINMLNDSAISGFLLNTQDITERRRAEKEERMKSKMQSLSENSLDVILRLSLAGQFYYANPVVEDYIGLAPKDLINFTYKELLLSEELRLYFESTIKEIMAKPQKTNSQLTLSIKLGEKESNRIISFDAIPEYNESELETILFVGHDITEAKRIQLEIQEKSKKIEDSINYAYHIQSSILPNLSGIRKHLPQSFMYYVPRDVVSGDFPWFFVKGNSIYIAAVDCTGHGVPGAMLSFIGYFLLNNIVDHDFDYTASQVCDKLHYGVRYTLKQDQDGSTGRDGMDIALCKINLDTQTLEYAGAHRPLYLLRNNEIIEYKGDKKAIGGKPLRNIIEEPFVNNVIEIQKDDTFLFFSDGMPDQLGGVDKKKYTSNRIKEVILNHPKANMDELQQLYADSFENWKKDHKAIDDVLLIGIRF